MTKTLKKLNIIFFLFLIQISFGQKKEHKVFLIEILNKLEATYSIGFNYSNDLLKKIKVYEPKSNLKIESVLEKIFEQIDFKFTILEDGQIIISKKNRTNKITVLDEVIINNILTKGISIKKGGKITIKPNEFKILPGLTEPDILQSIQSLPGVISANKKLSDINIRGGTHDQNLFLWNNIKMYQTGHFFGLISPFNPYLIKEVNLFKNGTSALYGDGVSSIIEMKNKRSNNKETTIGFGLDLLSFDGFVISPLSEKTELQIAIRRAYTDLFRSTTYNSFFERIFQNNEVLTDENLNATDNEEFFFYDISTSIYHNFNKNHKMEFNLLHVVNNLEYKNSQSTDSFIIPNSLFQVTLALGMAYTYTKNKFDLKADFYLSGYSQSSALNNKIDNNETQIFSQENLVTENNFKLVGNYPILDNFNTFFGYQRNETSITNSEDILFPSFEQITTNEITTHSLFYELGYKSNDNNFESKVGLRTNYFNKFDEFNFEPRLSINYNFLENFKLELLGEFKSQVTSQIIDLTEDFLGVESKRWVLSNNNNIPILKSKQISFALRYKKANFIISLETYLKNVDGVTARSQGFLNQYQFSDSYGNQKSSGIELLIHNKFKNIKTWLTYNYNNNSILLNGLNSNNYFSTNQDIRHTLSINSSIKINQFNFAVSGNWHTGKPFTSINAIKPLLSNNSINFNKPNSNNLDNYLRVDLSMNYIFNSNNRLGLSFWNLLNTRNTLNTYYIKDQNNINTIQTNSLSLTPNLSFRMNF
jgi:hypothetical protein